MFFLQCSKPWNFSYYNNLGIIQSLQQKILKIINNFFKYFIAIFTLEYSVYDELKANEFNINTRNKGIVIWRDSLER